MIESDLLILFGEMAKKLEDTDYEQIILTYPLKIYLFNKYFN